MTKKQRIMKAIYYYSIGMGFLLGICTIVLAIYGFVNLWFFDSLALDFIYLIVIGLLGFVVFLPFFCYIKIFISYQDRNSDCYQITFQSYYLKNFKFWIPVIVFFLCVTILVAFPKVDHIISKYTDVNMIYGMQEDLDGGIRIDIPYQENSNICEGTISIKSKAEIYSLFSDSSEVHDYLNETDSYHDNYVFIVLPVHKGELINCEIDKATMNFGWNKTYYSFNGTVDDSEELYWTCYIVNDKHYGYGHVYKYDYWESTIELNIE